jgi:tRNA(His) guanylyltransferase
VFLWREFDATKNSISMAAQVHYTHEELMNKNSGEKQEMLWRKGVNWNDFPSFFKRGTYVQRRTVFAKFSTADIEALPPKHNARKNPDVPVERTTYGAIEMPPFSKVTNRPQVIFDRELPKVEAEYEK